MCISLTIQSFGLRVRIRGLLVVIRERGKGFRGQCLDYCNRVNINRRYVAPLFN
jgi:hypothetical protein